MDGDRLGMAITNRAARCGSSPRCRVDVKAARAGSIPAPSANVASHSKTAWDINNGVPKGLVRIAETTGAEERQMEKFNFSIALAHLKNGRKVAREGWNEKDQWVMLTVTAQMTTVEVYGKCYRFAPYLQLKNAYDEMVPWQPSQDDMLADDWMVV